MNIPKISIIIPIYNTEKWLSRCLDSIINQTFNNFEIILINDGSQDSSPYICNQYAQKDQRISVYNIINSGVSTARNTGIKYAKGEFILFIDADDWIEYNCLENYIKYDADIIFQGYKITDGNKNIIKKIKLPFKEFRTKNDSLKEVLFLFSQKEIFGYTWSKIFRRSIIEEHNIRFYENISIREDEIFTLNYCKYINSIITLPNITYNYFTNDLSLMRRKYISPFELENAFNLSYKASDFLKSFDKSNFINTYYLDSIIWCLHMGYYRKKLLPRSERLRLINIINKYIQLERNKISIFFFKNKYVIDFFFLIKYYLKLLINKD